MRVAFYAPLKAPDHPVPSGDRTLARLLYAALRRAGASRGWEVEVASRFRSFEGAGDAARQARLREVGARFADRLMRRYRNRPVDLRPRLWFTYHLYHKAPDWLGPAISERLGIPYVVAEASHAPKQAGGGWSPGYEAAAAAIQRADAILALNRDDVPGVREAAGDASRITVLPPFLGSGGVLAGCSYHANAGHHESGGENPASPLDFAPATPVESCAPDGGVPLGLGASTSILDEAGESADGVGPMPGPEPGSGPGSGPGEMSTMSEASEVTGARATAGRRWGIPIDEPWLLCVAMMRGGRKLTSFEVLADALARLQLDVARWHLVVAGDGPARREVEAALARRVPAGRVTFTGRVEGGALAALYAGSDLFVWPAVGEPMGMALLEAQGHGLPVVAARTRGVPDLVSDSETGLLAPEGDAAAFADAVRTLLQAPGRRRRMGRSARARVAREHSFEAASERIGALVETLVHGRTADAAQNFNPGRQEERRRGKRA